MLNIYDKMSDGTILMKKDHRYYYQIQWQMAVTGINMSYFVIYTYKGIFTIEID